MKNSTKLAIVFGALALAGCKQENPVAEQHSVNYTDPLTGTTHTIVYESSADASSNRGFYAEKGTDNEYMIGAGSVLATKSANEENWTVTAIKPDGTPYVGTVTNNGIYSNNYQNHFTETDSTKVYINKDSTVFAVQQADQDMFGSLTYLNTQVMYKMPNGKIVKSTPKGTSFSVRDDYTTFIEEGFNVIQISNSGVFTKQEPLRGSSVNNTQVMYKMPDGELYTGETSEKVRMQQGIARWTDTKGTEVKVSDSGVTSVRAKGDAYCTVMFKDSTGIYTGKALDVAMNADGASFTDTKGVKYSVDNKGKVTTTVNLAAKPTSGAKVSM